MRISYKINKNEELQMSVPYIAKMYNSTLPVATILIFKYLRVPRNFEMFHHRLGPGRWNWGNHITAWNLVASCSLSWSGPLYEMATLMFAFSGLGQPGVLSFSERLVLVLLRSIFIAHQLAPGECPYQRLVLMQDNQINFVQLPGNGVYYLMYQKTHPTMK